MTPGQYQLKAVATDDDDAAADSQLIGLTVLGAGEGLGVRGRVVDQDGVALVGVRVTLSGDASATAQTDALGEYEFDDLTANKKYVVTPALDNYVFEPLQYTFASLSADERADFVAYRNVAAGEHYSNLLIPNGAVRASVLKENTLYIGGDFTSLRVPGKHGVVVSTFSSAVDYRFARVNGKITAAASDGAGGWYVAGTFTEAGEPGFFGQREVKRVNVSAAFFLSIEFQETGFLAYRMGLASYGEAPKYRRLMSDSRAIAAGVQVGIGDWEARLAANRRAFADAWVSRAEFKAKYGQMTEEQYVAALLSNAKLDASRAEPLVSALKAGTMSRAEALLRVADDAELKAKEKSRAFVLMQYYGYLRRDPDAGGFDYWLGKLDGFGGDFIRAEMVKAFLDSVEYRRRFETP